MPCRHYLVSGRVQGVSFRNFTLMRALALGLRGWVRNLRDGRVEIMASGADNKLKEFEDAIARGPILARVDSIDKSLANWEPAAVEFQIHDDGEIPWQAQH